LKTPEHVTLLINLLEKDDVTLRHHIIRFITVVCGCPYRQVSRSSLSGMLADTAVKNIILQYPHGVTRLIEMLSDRKEVIRNGMAISGFSRLSPS